MKGFLTPRTPDAVSQLPNASEMLSTTDLKQNLKAFNFFSVFDPHLPPPVSQPTPISHHMRKIRDTTLKRYKRYLAIAALFTTTILFIVGAFWLLVGNKATAAHTPGFLLPFILLMVGAKIFVPFLVVFSVGRSGAEV
ncbi:uncharacterized protein AB675_7557 [Cyphellophora attinorum]|uniref:Uncharacterized protein n=1 Tax=Cyphellophora attinorum TaxID=1664694 RepID=A0A0N1HB66_9EURO|nr:uncharacterized protein AB675_7557 [Phialophora attinorum]KPI40304.1 hypothetical protein AB675_7557 [Phialophora attinorum]